MLIYIDQLTIPIGMVRYVCLGALGIRLDLNMGFEGCPAQLQNSVCESVDIAPRSLGKSHVPSLMHMKSRKGQPIQFASATNVH